VIIHERLLEVEDFHDIKTEMETVHDELEDKPAVFSH